MQKQTTETSAQNTQQQQQQQPQSQQQPQAQPQAQGYGGLQSSNILGSKLSILTTAQVRYEGVLSEVDPVNKAMTLINVKSFGTEGRRNGVNEIPPTEGEISEARFKVDHIKDFKIIEKPNPTLLDPAIISTTNTQSQPKKETIKPQEKNTPIEESNEEQKRGNQPQQQQQWRNSQNNFYQQRSGEGYQQRRGGDYHHQQRGGHYHQGGRGGYGGHHDRDYQQHNQHHQQREHHHGGHHGGSGGGHYQQKKPVGELQQNPNEVLKDQLKETFDFQQHQLKDDKEEVKKQTNEQLDNSTGGDSAQEQKPKYDKSMGFFDAITNSTQLKPDQQRSGDARQDVRKKDAETFGISSSSNFQYSDNRGRGRGGRGGYRGNRGGYHNQEGGRGGYHNQEGGRGGYHQSSGRGYNNNYRGGYQNQGSGGYNKSFTEGYQQEQSYGSRGRGGRGRGGYSRGGAGQQEESDF